MIEQLKDIIKELSRCALENEKEAKGTSLSSMAEDAAAGAVADEQRRMLYILRKLLREAQK